MSAYKNFSADLAKAVERSKKDKRLESKKKKALAFLKLIEMNQDVSQSNSHRVRLWSRFMIFGLRLRQKLTAKVERCTIAQCPYFWCSCTQSETVVASNTHAH